MSAIDWIFLAVTVFAALYGVAGLLSVVWFVRRPASATHACPPVTVLKPLRGDDGCLLENLRTFCEQDYPECDVIFGIRAADDAAVGTVQRLLRDFRDSRLELVVDDRAIGSNLKISNVANIARRARHETVIVADGDMRVGPDYVRAVVAPLEDPSVGLVTCLYSGVAAGGLASTLGAMFINEWFLPAALFGTHLEPLHHAFGATIACRRETLRMIGGFEAVADHLADDCVLARLVTARGLRVVLSHYVVTNMVAEPDLRTLFFRELRWARTFRMLRPGSYFCSLFTHGVPWSLLWLAVGAAAGPAFIATAFHLSFRALARIALYRCLRRSTSWRETCLVPVRDAVTFAIAVLSFFGNTVRWNGDRLRVGRDGRLAPQASDGALEAALRRSPVQSKRGDLA